MIFARHLPLLVTCCLWFLCSSFSYGDDAKWQPIFDGRTLDGWVVGQGFFNGSIFHTTDGGQTWTAATDTTGDLVIGTHVAVDFEGDNGWAAGSSDRYYRTTDGGASWIESYLPDPSGFLGVRLTLATLFWWLELPVEWIYAALIGDYIVKSIVLTTRFGRGRWQRLRV